MKELFQKIEFFAGLEDKILKKMAEAAIMRQYAKDETIVRQGEMGLGLYIIVRGRVRVDREQGDTRVQVAELGPEQFFAEMSIVDNKPRSASVTTLEDTECLLLTRDSFVKLMKKYPEIPMRLARLLAERLRIANEKLAAAPQPAAAAQPATAAISGPPSAPRPAPTPGNGNIASAAPAAAAGTKSQIQDALLKAFQSLYTMKAFTRFSVAVLGCPVECTTPGLVDEFRVGDVKALLVPAGERVELNIAAHAPGAFTLHVFVPSAAAPIRFGPIDILPEDRFQLLLDPPSVRLRGGGRVFPPASA